MSLKGNRLEQLPSGIFDNLVNLKALHINNNNFSSLPNGLLRNNVKLLNFHLYNNAQNLTKLPNGLFRNLTGLTSLNLKKNGLVELPEDLFEGATSLTILSLESNFLETLPKLIFKDMHHLTSLNLSNNRLHLLKSKCFANNTELVQLDLSSNSFKHYPSIILYGLNFLLDKINIDLSHNEIEVINVYGSDGRDLLRLQDILATLSDQENSVVTVRVNGNPLICDCNVYTFLLYLESELQKFVEIAPGDTKCEAWRGFMKIHVPIIQLNTKTFECIPGYSWCPRECTCWLRDSTDFINCAYRNLTRFPEIFGMFHKRDQTVLDLTGNFIEDIEIPPDSDYGSVDSLILSHNNLSSISPQLFTANLKVSD